MARCHKGHIIIADKVSEPIVNTILDRQRNATGNCRRSSMIAHRPRHAAFHLIAGNQNHSLDEPVLWIAESTDLEREVAVHWGEIVGNQRFRWESRFSPERCKFVCWIRWTMIVIVIVIYFGNMIEWLFFVTSAMMPRLMLVGGSAVRSVRKNVQ
jgi:hypothetical protein